MTNQGRRGKTRYLHKRVDPISPIEVEVMLDSLNDPRMRSLLIVGYYTGLRLAELVGDRVRKWKVLSAQGETLYKQDKLPKHRAWMKAPELWVWRWSEGQPGVKREDIQIKKGVAYITSKPLKHGKREYPLELPMTLPNMNLLAETLYSTKPDERLWPFNTVTVWRYFTKVSGHTIYPHSLRYNRASSMANTEGISLGDMLNWFGWARASTADSYLNRAKSMAKARASIVESMREEVSQ